MTYVIREPDVAALAAIAALVASARVLAEPRRLHLTALGVAYTSEIALPGDTDYDADGEKLALRCDLSPHGLVTETATLPLAFVFAGDAAALEDERRPGDNPAFEVELRLAFKFRDTPGNNEMRQRTRCLVRDFVRRLRNEKAASVAQGGTLRVDAVAETAGADAADADLGFLFFDVPLVLAHPGDLLPV